MEITQGVVETGKNNADFAGPVGFEDFKSGAVEFNFKKGEVSERGNEDDHGLLRRAVLNAVEALDRVFVKDTGMEAVDGVSGKDADLAVAKQVNDSFGGEGDLGHGCILF